MPCLLSHTDVWKPTDLDILEPIRWNRFSIVISIYLSSVRDLVPIYTLEELNMENTFDRIVEILRAQCDLDESVTITMDTTFKDIDLDSLDVVEIALECENEFGITIDVEEPPKTMGEFVELVDSLIG